MLPTLSGFVKIDGSGSMPLISSAVMSVAALNVRTQTYNIVGAVTLGVGQALLPVAGMFFGEEDRTALRDTMKTTLRLGLTLSILVAIILIPVASMFPVLLGVSDPVAISIM